MSKLKYTQHFSTRIPWKDNDYTGKVDDNPRYNVSAQVIPNISESRNLNFEEDNKSKRYKDIDSGNMKSWITENAAFMSEDKLYIKVNHPYKGNSNLVTMKRLNLNYSHIHFYYDHFHGH